MNANNPQIGSPDEGDPFDDTMHAVEEVAEEAKSLARHAEATMSAPADNVAQHAMSAAEEGDMATEVAALAGAIGKASEELDDSDQAVLAGFASNIAGGIETMSSALEQGDNGLTDRLRQFARTQPAAFLGTAVLAGLAANRRAKMSAHKPRRGMQTYGAAGAVAQSPLHPAKDDGEVEHFEQGLGSSGDTAAGRSRDDYPQTGKGPSHH